MWGTKGAMVWFGFLIVLGIISGVQVARSWRLQTDVLALLPKHEREQTTHALKQLLSGTLGRTAFFLIGHAQPEVAQEATRTFGFWLEQSVLFDTVWWDYSRQQQAFFDLYFPRRYTILGPRIRQMVSKSAGYDMLVWRLQSILYQPTASLTTRLLAEDPLLLFPALAQTWAQRTSQLRVEDGLLTGTHQGRTYHLVTARLAFNPFDTEGQTQFEAQWQRWQHDLSQRWPKLGVISTSVAQFASTTRHHIHQDIVMISVGSLLGVALLTLGTFRTLWHLMLALIPITAGIWSALGLCLWWFGDIHALTLAFGASLIGICIDYSFHYFAHHRINTPWHAVPVMRALSPALGLGALTTVLSFLSLALTPLIGLQQIAVFASCGIVVAFGTVVLGFPPLLSAEHARSYNPPHLYRMAKRYVAVWQRRCKLLIMICSLGVAICIPGLRALQISDSPQTLNALPLELKVQDQLLRQIVGLPPSQTYLLVTGATAEDALQTLEHTVDTFRAASVKQQVVEFGPILTDFLPSLKRQQADRHALHSLLSHRAELTEALTELGFDATVIKHLLHMLKRPDTPFLTPTQWRQHEASVGLRHLWLDPGGQEVSIVVPIRRVNQVDMLQAMVDSLDDVRYIDQVNDFTRVFKRYRQQAMRLAGVAYGFIFGLLLWRYGKRGVLLVLPPVLAALITVGVLGLLGQPFHLIHCLALLLILGMGVDYTIFICESPPGAAPVTLLALSLSALTTLLSFGLLSLSSQAVLQAIGLTTLIGIVLALCLAPLAQYGQPTS